MSSDPNATPATDETCCADNACCTADEIMAKIKPSLSPSVGAAGDAGQVQGPLGDALIAIISQVAPLIINAILAHFHISKKPTS